MKSIIICFISVLLFAQTGCKKKEKAGYGGNASFKLAAKHHGSVIDSCTFYIKFNVKDAPAPGTYDITKEETTISVGNSYALISGLKKGDYYIYAYGWDPSISSNVSGGFPYTITEEKEISLDVAVTEIH